MSGYDRSTYSRHRARLVAHGAAGHAKFSTARVRCQTANGAKSCELRCVYARHNRESEAASEGTIGGCGGGAWLCAVLCSWTVSKATVRRGRAGAKIHPVCVLALSYAR